MKKIALFFVAALCSMAAMAAQYTGKLTVSINGEASTQDGVEVTINDNGDGTYSLNLNNFQLVEDEDVYPVGNISVDNLLGVKACGFTALAVTDSIQIPAGDLEGVDFWLGPNLGDVPIALTALFNDDVMRVHIDIDMTETALGQMILVDFETPGVDAGSVRGDMTGDGIVDVEDVNVLINIILKKI
ncbi:MAG: calycin-like domain-containing protein [Muribaculaceae bacterium]|nr:calycin-like domain-containing protein [Muribaculaceae bacterium]